MPSHEDTPLAEFDRSQEEFGELHDAVKAHDGSRQSELEIGGEATDVIIRMLGLMTIVGCNATEMLQAKIDVIHQKYPPEKIGPRTRAGESFSVVMGEYKTVWEAAKRPLLNKRNRGPNATP